MKQLDFLVKQDSLAWKFVSTKSAKEVIIDTVYHLH